MTEVSDYRTLPPEVQKALRKYRIISTSPVALPDGSPAQEGWTRVTLEKPDTSRKPMGEGPMVDPSVIDRLLKADSTPDKAWFDWLLFQSGGGKEAQSRSKHLIQQSKERFIEERVRGYNDTNGVPHRSIPREKAIAQWEAAEPKFVEMLSVGDEDLVDNHQIFGFYREWPGKNRVYEKAALAVSSFLKLAPKIKKMNAFMAKQGSADEQIDMSPRSYGTIDALQAAINKVTRFYASLNAREDVRRVTIYDDDYIRVIAPLTYAAAVKYGWDAWAWANRNQFEQSLKGNVNDWQHPWKKTTKEQNVFVYIQFKVEMPTKVGFDNNSFTRHSLRNLALVLPPEQLKNFNPETVRLYDEENNNNVTLQQIKQTVMSEPAREHNPDEYEYPIHPGNKVFQSQEEAQEVVNHLDAALHAIKEWGQSFDPKNIVSDFIPA
jgi:hypothetical protein